MAKIFCIMMTSHGYHRSIIFVLFFLYFGSTGFPSVIKLSLTSGSTTWSDFSSRTTITFAENPDFEIGLELNSPFEFCTAHSSNNRVDSLHRKLLSYRQNRNDAKIYSSVRVAISHLCGNSSVANARVHIILKFIRDISLLHAGNLVPRSPTASVKQREIWVRD